MSGGARLQRKGCVTFSMPENRLFCFGCGYTAQALVLNLRSKSAWSFAGTTRSPDKTAAMRREGVEPLLWHGGELGGGALNDATHILVSTPPGEQGCPALAGAGAAIAARAASIKWLGYLSTNGVYGDHDGAWVDETSELRGTSARARRRIDAETAWRALADKAELPLIIFRLPGIYGPGRSALDSVREGKAKRVFKEGQVFSRMHADDIAAALAASMERPNAHNLYNLADDEPAPPQDVIAYACDLLGVAPPPLVPLEEAGLSDMGKSFYADNKRVSNRRMKDALDVALKFPSYREGLRAILAAEK